MSTTAATEGARFTLIDKTVSFQAAHDKARMQDAAVLRQRAKVELLPDAELAKFLPERVARPGGNCEPEIIAAKVSSTCCLACSSASAGSARVPASYMYALSARISGPGPDPWAMARAGDSASPAALVAVKRRKLRKSICVANRAREGGRPANTKYGANRPRRRLALPALSRQTAVPSTT